MSVSSTFSTKIALSGWVLRNQKTPRPLKERLSVTPKVSAKTRSSLRSPSYFRGLWSLRSKRTSHGIIRSNFLILLVARRLFLNTPTSIKSSFNRQIEVSKFCRKLTHRSRHIWEKSRKGISLTEISKVYTTIDDRLPNLGILFMTRLWNLTESKGIRTSKISSTVYEITSTKWNWAQKAG